MVSTLWIRHNAAQNRLDSIISFAEEIADGAVDLDGSLLADPRFSREIDRRQKFLGLGSDLIVFVVNSEGGFVYSTTVIPSVELIRSISLTLDQDRDVQQFDTIEGGRYYVVKQPIKNGQNIIGSIIIVYPLRDINNSPEEIQFLILMLGGIALLGWIIIYTLTRKLAKPIKNVADAAKQIVEGNYDLVLDKNVKEQEIYDLIESFKDMAERLRKLEALRTELLAGVTHELKTPVTSISGLIQALKDGVVQGEEAQEFFEVCSSETARLQKMVEDLLDFNAFVTGDIKVEKENYNLNQLLQEISYQWLITQEDNYVTLNTRLPDKNIMIITDAMRLQQILYNLFNNAKQASTSGANIDVLVYEQDDEIRIDIKDNGIGIPEEEQPYVFECFFRGRDKKYKVRGLGLGLSFSKMIMKALGGDLILNNSSSEGTTFTLVIPIRVKN